MSEPAIKKAYAVLDFLSRDPETVRLAELRMKKILDEKSFIEGAMEEGRAEGMAQGHAEGRAEGKAEGKTEGELTAKLEIAKRLKETGMTLSEISNITGLLEEDLNRLFEKSH